MSRKELRRIHMLRQVMAQKLAQVEGGRASGADGAARAAPPAAGSDGGNAGLVHRGRGKSSNRRMPEPIKAKVLMPIRTAVWRLWADVGGGAVGGTPEHYAQ